MTQLRTKSEPEIERLHYEEFAPMPEQSSGRQRLVDRLRLLWRHRQFLMRVGVYGLLVSVFVAFLIPSRYQSTARLMPPDTQSGQGLALMAALSGRGAGLGGFASDLLGLKSSSALLVGILRSTTVQDRMVERFNLRREYSLLPFGALTIEAARDALEERTSVSEDRKSGIITIGVTDRDPQRARQMAAAYLEELNRVVTEASTSAARRERVFLEERLKSAKQELDQAAQEFSQFASKNAAIDIKEQGRAMVEAAATLQGQLIAARTELEGLRAIYTEENARVRAANARIGELQRQIDRLGGQQETAGSAGERDAPYPSIRKLPLIGVQYADLYRRTKIAEVIFELLTQQYELARVQEAKEIPSVKVLDMPTVPEARAFPPRKLVVISGLLLAMTLAAGCVLFRVRWDAMDDSDPTKSLVQDVLRGLGNGGARAGRYPEMLRALRAGWRSAPSGEESPRDSLSLQKGSKVVDQKTEGDRSP